MSEGRIIIWDKEKVDAEWSGQDARELFSLLPTGYSHALQGNSFYHCYECTDSCVSWDDPYDWYCAESDESIRVQLRLFVAWLKKHPTATWEVWT